MYNLLNFYIVYIHVIMTQIKIQNVFFITQKVPLGLFPMNTLAPEVFILTSITEEK